MAVFGAMRKVNLNRIGTVPNEPTDTEPGSDERIEILGQRAERRESLHHPQDRKADKRGFREE